MSQTGIITFFTESEFPNPVEVVRRVLELTGMEHVSSASRTLEPDRGWEALMEEYEKPFVAVRVDEDDVPTEYFKGPISLDDAARLYRPDVCTRLLPGRNRLGMPFLEAVQRAIPPEISDPETGFAPASPDITIGWHDLWENAEHEEGHLFGRAFFSLGMFGTGTPRNWNEYRRLIFGVPAVRQLKADLEAIVGGPLEQCVSWSV